MRLVVVGLKGLMGGKVTNWPRYAAALIPRAIVFMSIQKFIASGLFDGIRNRFNIFNSNI